MIKISNVTKTYVMGKNKINALAGVSLTVDKGDFIAIMGPSGSGKSTLAHILGLLDAPSSGSYLMGDREIANLDQNELAELRRQEIGFIFQQFNLLPRMSAADNVALPLFYSKKEDGEQRALELLKMVGLADRAHHRPNELSGGQQQRVAIARALANRPRIIIADEPTGNLDSISERDIMQALKELNQQGITIIMVTHEKEIGDQAARLISMRDGLIISDQRQRPLPKGAVNDLSSGLPVSKQSFAKDIMEHFVEGQYTLRANKVRTGLSMLGILIGVAAVVAMLALGSGAKMAIEAQLSSLGSNLLVVRPGSARVGGVVSQETNKIALSVDDTKFLKERVLGVKNIAPTVDGRIQVAFQNKNWNTQLVGTTPVYAQIRASRPTIGRFFTEDENSRRSMVALLGATVVKELFQGKNPIGETVRINKIAFQVIGVLPEKGGGGWRDQDDIVIIPLETALRRVLGKDRLDSIDIEMVDASFIEQAQTSIVDLLSARKKIPLAQKETAFRIMNMAEIQNAITKSSETMSLLLSSIAAISLLVGGIGIMNIMLVSVTERTREIGLRKAIGAKEKDIMMQFMAESIVVSSVGGLMGIILGYLITVVITLIAGWITSISILSILLAFFFSATVGLIFGIYPARHASRLHPIDALRHS